MKNFLSILFLILFQHSFSQSLTNVQLKWVDNQGLSSEAFKLNVPVFNSNNYLFDYDKNAIWYVSKINTDGFVDENSLQITNVSYQDVSIATLGDLNLKNIPENFSAKIENVINSESPKAVLKLSPIIKVGSSFKRMISFSYSFSLTQNKSMQTTFATNAVYNSVLASGEWFRFYVEKSGVYKISRSFLQSLGMNLNNVNPQNIKIYGNGGRMLPLLNATPYPEDLAENAIFVSGENDGSFDSSDYILFYAEGTDLYNSESLTHKNLYADRSYYYVTTVGGTGKRIQNMPEIVGNPTTVLNNFDDYQYHEIDRINIARLGRRWFGEAFNIENQQDYEFNFPIIDVSVPATVTIKAAASGFITTNMTANANNQSIGTLNFSPSTDSNLANESTLINNNVNISENTTISLTYNNNGVPSANAYLDYISISAKSLLRGHNKQFPFTYNNAAFLTGIAEYQFSNASGISQIWDITDIYNVTKTENAGNNQFSFKANLGETRKYIAVDPTDYFSPLKESQSRVANQNLKGTIFRNAQNAFQDVDYLIITHPNLVSQAERLADFHRGNSNLRVKVVSTDVIYEEFSSGKQDIGAIRNFAKYVYQNASTPTNRLKYINLFGDASFDYKNRIPNNTNIVPIFETYSSFSLGGSFMTDDFYAMYDPQEGQMNNSSHTMEVAVGRMLVSNSVQAQQMVNKVIEYHSEEAYGKWRNNFVLISDDVDEAWEASLQRDLDLLGDQVAAEKPFINIKKIHTDAYVQSSSSGGQRYPKAKEDIISEFEQGALVFNYFGHGGEDGLAKERIFERSTATTLNNRYKYPLFVTITCEFTRFDNPYKQTGGEETYWNPAGGAISLVTTTRQIDVNTGKNINIAFRDELFGFGTNAYVSIAEALRRAKNNYSNQVLMVSYIGDPAIKLAIPKPTIVLTKINDEPIASSTIVLNALSKIKLSGEVRDENGTNLLNSYNGELSVNIFDKNVERTTFGNDGVTDSNGLITMDFTLLGETIFRGNASVANGLFDISFVVPRDITIPVGNGRVSFYAKKNNPLEDQTGYNTEIKIGGINANATADNIGPTVRLYMNDETFISGGITNESPFFLAFLEDENGINTASGIGHDIIAILDGDENNPYILNDYYETELDDYTKGKVRFPFRNLAPGLHTITFKAWDVYNNPVIAEIQFIVVGDDTVTLKNVLNYPNPFVNYTQFWFTHNRPYEPLDVQVQIFTITGKIVKTINQVVNTEGFLSREITWDGLDDFGDKIGKGVYVYKLTVKSNLSNKKTEKIEKLVIL
ncbi:type IX secretion system sortase PorU [Flavobacterium sp. NST-5]|uniref:Type IX secretion system sortase PorU n=1 Tax=Flavobacterium ichthyis TaxID=2698827 RepID=A0ABW9Z471_9FLAO|nr:type IX secretion system sortase PorU [Flavobacterium ichthyis]NBL63633.1 type IX secretion system sortase PorU [Flavobacterium ichthyis]